MDQSESYLSRMIALADSFFAAKSDPQQLDITEEVMEHLSQLHPDCMGEVSMEKGPVAWSIVFPTSKESAELFLNGTIGEQELFRRALEEKGRVPLTMLYLCSALVLPEFRGKGLAKKIVLDSVAALRRDHPIEGLFVWTMSGEGSALAESVAKNTGLALEKK